MTTIQKITPCLWFDRNAEEAMNFYASIFKKSKIVSIMRYEHDIPQSGQAGMVGKVLTGIFEMEGQRFMCLDGGPIFKFNPSVSFLVACQTKEEVDELWGKLSPGGKALMELGEYPFSKRFGWTTDKFGVSWQVNLSGNYPYQHKIISTLLFVGNVAGRAEEAMNFYAAIFPDSKIGSIARYPAGAEPEREGTVMHGSVTLAGQEFFAMDSAREHNFKFNEAISFEIECKDQQEVDRYWNALSAVKESEQCGWLKDKFGVSWQIVPRVLGEMLEDQDREKAERVLQAMLQMKKIEIAGLERAYTGK